jgi:hypothetical protein
LAQIAKTKGLEWFKGIVLFTSRQDEYVSYHSSSIKSTEEHEYGNNSRTELLQQMVNSLLCNIKNERILRIDVNYQLK